MSIGLASLVAEHNLYGAIILDPQPEILTASAANTSISNQFAALAPLIQETLPPEAGLSVTVTDLAPWAEDDPSGAGFTVAGLPIIVTGFLGGFAIPSDFYPAPWGEIGQWLAPGASATLLRAESYFPERDVMLPWLILSGWTLLGALLLLTRPGQAFHSHEPESVHA